jgi:predicted DNA-binding antitoxin AbrB/MazE fold protein
MSASFIATFEGGVLRPLEPLHLPEGSQVEVMVRPIDSAATDRAELEKPRLVVDKMTGLPRIEGGHSPSPGEELTPERVADLLLAQEAEWHHAAGR